MSRHVSKICGGEFDYIQFRMDEVIDNITHICANNPYEYQPETLIRLQKALAHVIKTRKYIHTIDYLVSGDTGEETFIHETAELS